jgi:hypothetical protein
MTNNLMFVSAWWPDDMVETCSTDMFILNKTKLTKLRGLFRKRTIPTERPPHVGEVGDETEKAANVQHWAGEPYY